MCAIGCVKGHMSAPNSQSPAQKKGAQPSLTLCHAPALDWSRAAAPASHDFGDIYFSVEGGLEETRAVYLTACGLPERWAEPQFAQRTFVVGELGFGTGLNFLALWQMWKAHKQDGQRLHYVSVEKFPLSHDDLKRALTAWPSLKDEAAALLALWPGRVRGTHILHLGGGLTLTLCHDDVDAALAGLSMRADAWFLDGFSPAKNPQMWRETVMERVGALSARGARIGTFTAAGFVRKGLAAAGFNVRKTEGFGRKRHRLEAVMPVHRIRKRPPIAPVIIGGGIAGASLAAAFARRGIRATIIDADDGTAASGNAAAIIKPRLDRQDSPLARFALCSYLYALQTYGRAGAVISQGVTHAPQTPEQILRFKSLAAEPALPPEHMQLSEESMIFPKAQVIDPDKARAALTDGVLRVFGRAVTYRRKAQRFEVLDANGDVLAVGSPLIFAAGAGVRGISAFDSLALRYSRGQISWARAEGQDAVLTYGGYAVPLGQHMLLGATHARLTEDDPYIPNPEDDAHNFEAYRAATGRAAAPALRASRASVRVNSKTTWPVIAELETGVFAMTGLGSRGFVFAPLMAEMLAAELCGDPVDWPAKLRRA